MSDNSIRYVLEGREPKLGKLIQICDALGLEFYVGPPRGGENLYLGSRDTDQGLSESHLCELESHTQGLVRLTAQAGGDPIPPDLRAALLGPGVAERDGAKLVEAIEVCERGLAEAGKTMGPSDKAKLVGAIYTMLETEERDEVGANVIRLIQRTA